MTEQKDIIGSYFLDVWRLNSKSAAAPSADEPECEEEGPTELNTLNSSGGFSIVGSDKLSVQYPNVNLHGHDVGVVQANKPAPRKRLVFYFEIFVKNAGAKGQMSIGFTAPGFKMRRQPGWEANSYGYHGDDGYLYRGHGKGEPFGPTFSTGDRVGGGINYATQEFFFTKNGAVVGAVAKELKGPLYPTVAVHSQNEEIIVNFGKDPFVFDLKAFEAEERRKQQSAIDNVEIPLNGSHGIVRSYLQHYGYEETLNLFDMASRSTVPPTTIPLEVGSEGDKMFDINKRKLLRQLIKNGEIDDAFGNIRTWYPWIVQDDKSAICFLFQCQKFIELIRGNKLHEAVTFGRSEFEKFAGLAEFNDLMEDCATLLAYEQPLETSIGYLLLDSHREILADAVNSMILSGNGGNISDANLCLRSRLERLLRQLTACYWERRVLNGEEGEAFNLCRVLNSSKKD